MRVGWMVGGGGESRGQIVSVKDKAGGRERERGAEAVVAAQNEAEGVYIICGNRPFIASIQLQKG